MSQHNIDKIVSEAFTNLNNGKLQPGIFLEAGGSNPIAQNNTYFLEQNGWRGLVVEPRTAFNESYKIYRPNTILENYVLVDNTYTDKEIDADLEDDFMGGVPCDFTLKDNKTVWDYHKRKNLRKFPCISLQKLLDKHKFTHINFFSLDVEGYERYVLSGVDFNKTTFDLIVLEFHDWTDFSYLNNYGYFNLGELLGEGAHHYFYIHQSHINTKSRLFSCLDKVGFYKSNTRHWDKEVPGIYKKNVD